MQMRKELIYPALALAYAAALLLSLLIVLKPGAAIFHFKLSLAPANFQRDIGCAYRYKVNLPAALFLAEKALLFEDGQLLSRAAEPDVIATGNGLYAIEKAENSGFFLYLAPTGNSDPGLNGSTYRLFSPLSILSRSWGIVYFSILLFGLFWFASFALSASNRSQLRSLSGLVQLAAHIPARLRSVAVHISTQGRAPWRSRLAQGGKLFLITAAAAYALMFMEWIFQVTKISFMDGMQVGQKVSIFLLSGLALTVLSLAANAALLLAEFLLRPLRLAWLAICLNAAIPAFLLTSMAILMLDSFTYTIFHVGVLTATGLLRLAYGVGFICIFLGFYRWLLRIWGVIQPAGLTPSGFKWLRATLLGILLLSSTLAVAQIHTPSETAAQWGASIPQVQDLPDIILIASDGLSAQNMSAYGYPRDTTPNIKALAQVSLLAENAFTNSAKTYGSIISILTGKMPTRTQVIYPPDILKGADSYQHLPGILKDLGYTNVQIGVETYVDANTWNIQNGFDIVNQQTANKDVLVRSLYRLGYDYPALFILTVEERLADRLFQAFYLDTIPNPFTVVTTAREWWEDSQRLDDLLAVLEHTEGPVFAQVHMMGTHGPRFNPAQPVYSQGQEQYNDWMTDFYDDTILAYDSLIGELVESLKTTGQYDHTILILFSDHAVEFQARERVPLIIHFPGDQHARSIQTNVQNLDIAPTLLDYLGIPVPEWMEGESILQFSTQVRQPLFTMIKDSETSVVAETLSPADSSNQFGTGNYRFSAIEVIYCQRVYHLDFGSQLWSTFEVSQHTAPCAQADLLDLSQVSQALVQFLASQGCDTTLVP